MSDPGAMAAEFCYILVPFWECEDREFLAEYKTLEPLVEDLARQGHRSYDCEVIYGRKLWTREYDGLLQARLDQLRVVHEQVKRDAEIALYHRLKEKYGE